MPRTCAPGSGTSTGTAHAKPWRGSGIRRLNESHGVTNSLTSGYHETITAAYVRLLAEFLEGGDGSQGIDHRAPELLAGPLASRDARAAWVEPDVAPLALNGLPPVL